MIWIGSRIGLGAPVLLTDRSEKEKRSRLGGSSFGTGRGWSVAISVSWTLNLFGSIVEVEKTVSLFHADPLSSRLLSIWTIHITTIAAMISVSADGNELAASPNSGL